MILLTKQERMDNQTQYSINSSVRPNILSTVKISIWNSVWNDVREPIQDSFWENVRSCLFLKRRLE